MGTLPEMRVLVAGLINLESTVAVEAFPLPYTPVRYSQVEAAPSGVGWNLALALHTLGSEVHFVSLVGDDPAGSVIRTAIADSGIAATLAPTAATPQSVILSDPEGRRRIETDLKQVQDTEFPADDFDRLVAGCDLALLSNVNWTRPLLARSQQAGVPIGTDLHAVASLDNPYDSDYLDRAAILFMSGERLPEAPDRFAVRVLQRSPAAAVGIGLGAQGALLATRDTAPRVIPAVSPRAPVSTVGAGDALLAAFCHFRGAGHDPAAAMRRAVVFAGWKVGAAAGAAGFLDADAIERLLDDRP